MYKPYQFLEHTGDIKMHASGKTLEELFVNAALGMMGCIYGNHITHAQKSCIQHINLNSQDLESLLVDWLSELLYLSDINNCAYLKYDIQKFKSGTEPIKDGSIPPQQFQIQAIIHGTQAQAVDEIKAVTYHGLKIMHKQNLWEATIIFDV